MEGNNNNLNIANNQGNLLGGIDFFSDNNNNDEWAIQLEESPIGEFNINEYWNSSSSIAQGEPSSDLNEEEIQYSSDAYLLGSSDASSPDISAASPMNFLGSNFQDQLEGKYFPSQEFNFESNDEVKLDYSAQSMNVPESSNPKKRGRPKKVPKPNESTDVSRVQVDEADLIQFTSKTYEDWVSKMEKERPFTFAEEQVMKLQRRRIKNRESAHNSREKKRIASCQLTNQIAYLQKENQDLKKQLEYYKNENRSLAEQLSKFLGTKVQTVTTPIRKGISKPKGVAAGTVLLAVFLCFGIFFGGLPVQQSHSASSSHSTSRALFELGNVQNTSNFQCPSVSSPTCPSTDQPYSPPSEIVPHQKKTEKQVLQEWEDSNSNGEMVKVDLVREEYMNGSNTKSSTHLSPKTIPTFKPIVNWDVMKNPPNTHHFIVSGIEQIFPPNTSENVKDEPYKMNFIVSSKSLPNASPTDERVVQILTQVIDISFISEGVATKADINIDNAQQLNQVVIH